jgi:hypothetical protein
MEGKPVIAGRAGGIPMQFRKDSIAISQLTLKAAPRRRFWRCHIDGSSPDHAVRDFLVPYIQEYDAFVFTMAQFVLPRLDDTRVKVIAPAIDPFATKNMELPDGLCKRAIADSGVDVNRPLLLQVSRFDPWKDPMGVIEAYRLVKKEIPGVQLALIGAMAGDDPEGWQLLDRVQEESAIDPDLFVFTNHLLRHSGERGRFGRAGREQVRRNFLLPRLARDELGLIKTCCEEVSRPRWATSKSDAHAPIFFVAWGSFSWE